MANDDVDAMVEVTSREQLTAILGDPMERAVTKERVRLHEVDRQWLSESPFCLVATADGQGRCDVSPKGDPKGFALALNDTTLAIPERKGNRRADGFHNVLANPHVGLLFFVPGRGDTLRINGRAQIVSDAPFFERMVVKGHRPQLALVVHIEQIFFHCAKALLRSGLWDATRWTPQALPSHAQLVKLVQKTDMTLEELETYYGPDYLKKLY